MNTESHRPSSARSRGNHKKWLLLGITAIIIIGSYFWYDHSRYQYFLQTPVDPSDTTRVSVIIKKGDTPISIGQKLMDKDLILDANSFKRYIQENNIDRKIIAGRFLLNKTLTIPKIADKITDSKNSEFVLTVPEGSTIESIDQRLVDLGVNQSRDFINATRDFENYKKYPFLDEKSVRTLTYPLEGFLFPDTYFIDPNNFNNQNLIDTMLKNFQKKLPSDLLNTGKQGDHTLLEIITMASIVEKEVKTNQDRPIVAGILWKRLEKGWQLGADATLLYLKNDREISAQDLKKDSPYNTRRQVGLPPGPIGNPGLKSIEAALNPEQSPYFYYLTRPDNGETVYAITNDEHNANRAKYL